jgi:hypothetical protein
LHIVKAPKSCPYFKKKYRQPTIDHMPVVVTRVASHKAGGSQLWLGLQKPDKNLKFRIDKTNKKLLLIQANSADNLKYCNTLKSGSQAPHDFSYGG